MIAAGAAVVAVVVIVLLNATSGGTSTSSSSAANSTHGSHHGARVNVPLKPADVSVTVLNGTETTNLAHDITQRLAGSGYKTGTPATATDQTVGSTVVGYRGRSNRAAALLVAEIAEARSGIGPASRPEQLGCSLPADVDVHGAGDRDRRGGPRFRRRHGYHRGIDVTTPHHVDVGSAQPSREGRQASPAGDHPRP